MSLSLFESELPSVLPNPQFIARAGATNRVVLLLGKPYEVKCVQPIVCVETSHSDVEVMERYEGCLEICRPVICEFVSLPLLMATPQGYGLFGLGGGGTTLSLSPEPEGYDVSLGACCCMTHNYNAGAGVTHPIGEGNYWTTDRAGRSIPYTNWSAGRLEWKIPIGWARYLSDIDTGGQRTSCDHANFGREDSRPLLIGNSEDAYKQIYTIDSSGTSMVEKFGYKLTRNRWLPFGSVSQTEDSE